MTIDIFIHFNGNAEEAFNFYKSVFATEFISIIRFKDLKDFSNSSISEEEQNKIMYIALSIGNNGVLKGSDVPSFMGKVDENENRTKISITTDTQEQADYLFNKLSEGGTVEFPISEGPWNSYLGMFRDKFGIEWMIEYSKK